METTTVETIVKDKGAPKKASNTKVTTVRVPFLQDEAKQKTAFDKVRSEVVSELVLTNKNWRKALGNFAMVGYLASAQVKRSEAFTACVKVYTKHSKDGIGFASAPGDVNCTFYVCDRENAKLGKPAAAAKVAALKSYLTSLGSKISSRFYADDCATEKPLLEKMGFAEVFRGKDKAGRMNVIYGIGYAPKKTRAPRPKKEAAATTTEEAAS